MKRLTSQDLIESPIAYKNAEDVKRQIGEFGLAGHIAKPWLSRKDKLSLKQLRHFFILSEKRLM